MLCDDRPWTNSLTNSSNGPAYPVEIVALENCHVVVVAVGKELGIVADAMYRGHHLRKELCQHNLQPPCHRTNQTW
eukprot:4657913-Karenia_brevis.AAC.1